MLEALQVELQVKLEGWRWEVECRVYMGSLWRVAASGSLLQPHLLSIPSPATVRVSALAPVAVEF